MTLRCTKCAICQRNVNTIAAQYICATDLMKRQLVARELIVPQRRNIHGPSTPPSLQLWPSGPEYHNQLDMDCPNNSAFSIHCTHYFQQILPPRYAGICSSVRHLQSKINWRWEDWLYLRMGPLGIWGYILYLASQWSWLQAITNQVLLKPRHFQRLWSLI